MDDQPGEPGAAVQPEHPAPPGMVLRTDRGQFRILELGAEGCLIEAPHGAVLPGYADIYQHDRQISRCLMVLTTPRGAALRCAFKRHTFARTEPPRDFAG